MIPPKPNEAFEQLMATVYENGVLTPETIILVFLGAAMAIRCKHCSERFIAHTKTLEVSG